MPGRILPRGPSLRHPQKVDNRLVVPLLQQVALKRNRVWAVQSSEHVCTCLNFALGATSCRSRCLPGSLIKQLKAYLFCAPDDAARRQCRSNLAPGSDESGRASQLLFPETGNPTFAPVSGGGRSSRGISRFGSTPVEIQADP